MNYCQIDEENKERIISLIKFLVDEVRSSGGDGDALWYSKYYDIRDIHKLIASTVCGIPDYWGVKLENNALLAGDNQEWLVITNKKESFDNRPSWSQCAIAY